MVPQPSPTPAPPARVTLGANNYKNAVTLSMGVASTAYMYSKLGVSIADRWLNVPISFFPLIACPEGGSMSIELTDKNSDRSLDPGDTVHLRWERCGAQGATTTGIVRVEVNDATPIPGGREYRLTVTVSDLRIERDASPSATVNFIAQVHYTRAATYDYTEIANAVFNSGQVIGDTGTSTLQVAFYQDNAAQTYQYSVGGTVSSGALGGELEFASPAPFTGVIGEYPLRRAHDGLGQRGFGGAALRRRRRRRRSRHRAGRGRCQRRRRRRCLGRATRVDGVVPVQLFAAFRRSGRGCGSHALSRPKDRLAQARRCPSERSCICVWP